MGDQPDCWYTLAIWQLNSTMYCLLTLIPQCSTFIQYTTTIKYTCTICTGCPCTDPPPDVTIQASGSSTAGGMYTLNCTAIIAAGLPGNPTISIGWLGPSGAAVTSGSGITLGTQATQGTTATRSLAFNPVCVVHAGGYTCQATLSTPNAPTGNNTSNISVIGKNITYSIVVTLDTSVNEGCG